MLTFQRHAIFILRVPEIYVENPIISKDVLRFSEFLSFSTSLIKLEISGRVWSFTWTLLFCTGSDCFSLYIFKKSQVKAAIAHFSPKEEKLVCRNKLAWDRRFWSAHIRLLPKVWDLAGMHLLKVKLMVFS